MKKTRIILGLLLIIPIVLSLFLAGDPLNEVDHPLLTMAFYIIGMPILVLNFWAWDAPHIIKNIFGTRE